MKHFPSAYLHVYHDKMVAIVEVVNMCIPPPEPVVGKQISLICILCPARLVPAVLDPLVDISLFIVPVTDVVRSEEAGAVMSVRLQDKSDDIAYTIKIYS